MRLTGKTMENKIRYRSDSRSPSAHSRRVTPATSGFLALVCASILMLSGCAAKSLRVDYKKYEDAYAQSSNRQMLLNLARLNQHHPTYFFKMGQISTQYRMQAAINGNGTYSPQGYPAGAGGGGTPSVLYEKDPTFTFIPVNDDATAQQLLKPMPAELFYVLFQQGWRVDQLLRLMVDHIEYRPDPNSDQVQVIRNVASESNKDSYLTFLRISALCYHLQRRGHLVFSADQQFSPIATCKGGEPCGMKFTDTKNAPQAKDIADAFAKNLVWQQDSKNPDTWQLGQMVTVPKFKLSPAYVKADKDHPSNVKAYDIEIDMPELAKVRSLDPTLGILDSNGLGFGILENSTPADASKSGAIPHGSAQLVMRSLIGMMAAAAQEEDTFDSLMALAKADPAQDPIPPIEMQPLLTLKWNKHDDKALTPALVQLDYMGKSYMVADPKTDNPLKASSWNRDNFRIITQLVSLVTVDISKFPVQQVLQLRTQ
jgi:hypothetical protein